MSVDQIVAVYGASTIQRGSASWEEAERCGRGVAELGLAVVTGGYGGAMEAVSAGAASAGGRVVGVTAPGVFPHRSGANPYVTETIVAGSITERIHMLVSMASAAIVLPGSLGTFSELVAAWNAAYVAPMSGSPARPVITVGDTWRELVDELSERLGAERSAVVAAGSVDEALRHLAASVVAG